MIVGVLFSGGKDSCLALSRVMEHHEVACLITVFSENEESYMFHTPNIGLTELQSQAIGIPIVKRTTHGIKEDELADLQTAIKEAKEKFGIEAVVTGAVESVYQSSRIQKICDNLGLWCFNPLWKMDQERLLNELLEKKFTVIISGVFAYPFDETWLGRELDERMINDLANLRKKYGISPSGEGGEIETTVLDAPFFKKKIEILSYGKKFKNNSGVFFVKKARLAGK